MEFGGKWLRQVAANLRSSMYFAIWSANFPAEHARMRSPSENLTELLSRLQLCTRRDLEQCEPTVRKLAQNLPDFDSVWIDALVQRRLLTAWQADVLQSSSPERLRLGEYVLTDTIGANTFAAWHKAHNRSVVIRSLPIRNERMSERTNVQLEHLQQKLADIRRSAPASICLPVHSELDSGSVPNVVSRFVPGWSADDLIVRGGRMPSAAVAEIGRQVLEAVAWLEANQLQHGEIVLRNVRLQPDGSAVLVSPFVARLNEPTLSFTVAQRLRDVETTAPELVGTGAPPDSRSELYAVGCVLWQLLTSRPVFLSADPVTRLLKGKEHDIPDVRSVVPDCPDAMARLIHSFTRRSPSLRPASCNAALHDWKQQCRTNTSATKSLLKRMPDRSNQRHGNRLGATRRTWKEMVPTVAAVVLMLSAFGAYGVSRGLVPMPLHLASTANSQATSGGEVFDAARERSTLSTAGSPAAAAPVVTGPELVPLPDPAGVISLKSGATYVARDVSFAGVMYVETTGTAPAILLADTSWKVSATQVVISNIQLRPSAGKASSEPIPTLDCVCDVLSLRDCVVDSNSTNSLSTSVRWQPSTGTARVVSLKNCVLSGVGYGLWLGRAPERCELDNVLFTKSGAGVRCDITHASDTSLGFDLNHVTHVGGTGFLDIVSESVRPSSLLIQLLCGESVVAPSAAIIRVAGPEDWSMSRLKVEFLLPERGNPTIIPPDVHPVVGFDRSLNQLVELPDDQLVVDSLLVARPLFQGTSTNSTATNSTDTSDYAEFELLDYEGPKLSPRMPGVVTTTLPKRI